MPDFSTITIETDIFIRPFLQQDSGWSDCNCLWANLCGWQRKYQYAYAILNNNTLVIRETTGTQSRFLFPQQNITHELFLSFPSLSPNGITLFSCSKSFVDTLTKLSALYPQIKIASISHDGCWDDYIYNTSNLSQLTGKRYQPKRNHINKFKTTFPNFNIESLEESDFESCLILAENWMKEELAKQPDSEAQNLKDELEYIRYSLQHFHRLDLEGLTLKVGKELAAFCFGAPLNNSTFNTCIEKASSQFPGSYVVINQAMAQRVADRFMFINREEDLGLEGLRHAKQSYYPCKMTEKYEVELSY